jgi:hypothetical protein
MKREIVYINEFRVEIDYSVEENLKSFKEEVLNRLYTIYKESSVNEILFSGGMDSIFILRSLQELGITPKVHTLSFAKDYTDYDSLIVKEQCKKFGVKEPEFFYMDKDQFFNHVNFLTNEKQVAYPALHCYYVDYYLSSMEQVNFFCGMACEYRTSNGNVIFNPAPTFMKKTNPGRLNGFECSETFLAFVNHPIFKENYLKPNPMIPGYGENIWRVRDLIYNDCYPEIGIIDKHRADDLYLKNPFHANFLPTIRLIYPETGNVKPYRFNAQEYFNRKAKND